LLPDEDFEEPPNEQAVVRITGLRIRVVDVRAEDAVDLTLNEQQRRVRLRLADHERALEGLEGLDVAARGAVADERLEVLDADGANGGLRVEHDHAAAHRELEEGVRNAELERF